MTTQGSGPEPPPAGAASAVSPGPVSTPAPPPSRVRSPDASTSWGSGGGGAIAGPVSDTAGGASTSASNGASPGSVTPVTLLRPRGEGMARHLPAWMGSIRFRLTLVYSVVLFGLAAIVVGLIYVGLSRSLSEEKIYDQVPGAVVQPLPGGGALVSPGTVMTAQEFERLTNERALEALRRYSFGALLVLFLASLGIGWLVAGMVLKPVERITDVAREITATDLSRRIHLGGPDDELKELADTFDDMLARIDMAFEEQRRFIHEASHELRNPLAVIRTNLEVTLADPGASADDLRQTMVVVERSTERMSRLVDDLLVYARKGTTSHAMGSVDVATLVDEAVEEFRAPADANGLTLDGASSPGLFVVGDRYALKQALANLLANAVRLAPPGSVVRVAAGRQGPWVWLAVEDQGPGIAAEDQERIFQRFFRGDERSARAEGRSGLGLTIVRQIVEAHGGEVKLVSEPGRGSAFALWLPASSAPTAAPGSTPNR